MEEELGRLHEEIKKLAPFSWSNVSFNYKLWCTMADGKIMFIRFKGSAVRCPFCDCKPKNFNDLKKFFNAYPEALSELFLSVLHFGLRICDHVFKVAFKMPIKKAYLRQNNPEDIAKVEARTQEIKDAYRAKGLHLFEVRDGGAGTSMDGNLARRVFDEPEFLSQQSGLSLDLILGYRTLWIALASSLPLCPQKFKSFCEKIKALYVEECGWYKMPPTLHKILEHASDILELFPATISSGQMSEEPQESSNKDVKSFQIQHSRQTSLKERNLDTFHRMMDRSDPVILSYLFQKKKNRRNKDEAFPPDVLALCKTSEEIAKIS